MTERDPFPFIVACGRSGTTLLQAMLNAHPEMAIPPEAHFLVPVGRKVRAQGGTLDVEDLVARWEGRGPTFRLWQLPPDRVREELRQARPRTYTEAVRALYGLYADLRGKTRYGDKTPKHVLSLPYLATILPEARFIHLIRDGRDVTSSSVARGMGAKDIAEGALVWKRAVTRGRRDGAQLGPERYMEVRYEDFVADPDRHLKEVCTFVELEYDHRMLDYRRTVDGILPGARLRKLHENVYRPPTAGLRDWRREMDAREVAVFETLAGDLLSELGYERAVPDPPPAVRREARRRRARVKLDWAVRRVRHRLGRPAARSAAAAGRR